MGEKLTPPVILYIFLCRWFTWMTYFNRFASLNVQYACITCNNPCHMKRHVLLYVNVLKWQSLHPVVLLILVVSLNVAFKDRNSMSHTRTPDSAPCRYVTLHFKDSSHTLTEKDSLSKMIGCHMLWVGVMGPVCFCGIPRFITKHNWG